MDMAVSQTLGSTDAFILSLVGFSSHQSGF